VQCWGAKSFADDLVTGRGVVLSRAATTLRSVETKPTIGRFVFLHNFCLAVPTRVALVIFSLSQILFSRTHLGITLSIFFFFKFCLAVPTLVYLQFFSSANFV
jgi:hypothetical protein